MNPNAKIFAFNPSVPAFVPTTSNPNSDKRESLQVSVNPQEKNEKETPQVKKEEEVSWEDSAKVEEVIQQTQKISIDESVSFSEEQIKKELERVAAEEGLTAEELLKEDEEIKQAPQEEIEEDKREHLNIIFIGHVDAGKSTISGNILFLTGQVDSRTIQKFQDEAKSMNRDSWFYAYIMDTNIEERQKGKTVEVGRASFETETKRYTILDAPGHKNYVPNMIGGAAQADVGVLVISARKGEFETGFNRGGQTREHTLLAKTLGVGKLIVVINKMDDPTVEWAKARYDEIVDQLVPFLKTVGYNVKTDVSFVPVSGIKGSNIKDPLPKDVCPWYDGPTILQCLDGLKAVNRLVDYPLRIPILDKFRDRGAIGALGKVEAGIILKGQQLAIYPNKTPVEVVSIIADETRNVKKAGPGENVKVAFKGIDEDSINRGFMICDLKKPVACQAKFEAQLAILELLPHKSIFSAGYSAIIHIHTAVEECTVTILIEQLDKKTGEVVQKKPKFVKNGAVVRCIIECAQPICLELFKDVQQLGRFTLRDEGKTIAIGKVTALGPKKKAEKNN